MRIDILTLFPGMFRGPFDESIIKRAVDSGVFSIHIHDIRQWAKGRHKVADDYVYGGGPGMVLKPEPVFEATEVVLELAPERGPVVLLTPSGRKLDHELTLDLAREKRLILVCGHYEGVDARVHEHLATHEVSIGDYVLSGGELAAMVVVDAVVRQLPGVLGDEDSAAQDSFVGGLLDCPHYTRPEEYAGERVPPVLLSGNHAEIERWRLKQALGRTWLKRPELVAARRLNDEELKLLEEFKREQNT